MSMTPFVTDSGLVFSDPTPHWDRPRNVRRRTERVLRTKTVERVSERERSEALVEEILS